jgi:ABC-type transport system substrate-binding protein
MTAELRFGVVGQPTDVNVWALFDEAASSYANYAVRSEYWPRLYGLSVPDREFIPLAAKKATAVAKSGELYAGSVTLRDDLNWTDGSRLRAQDVAFTVNTALTFELGLDWKAAYNFAWLERAEAIDDETVRFFFRKAPDVGTWQYGALQGPIVQQAYWEPRIQSAAALLPDDVLRSAIPATESERDTLRAQVAELNARVLAVQFSGKQDRDLEMALRRRQGDLDAANNLLVELTDEYVATMAAARDALYRLGGVGEPTLGAWIPDRVHDGAWFNTANPRFPYGRPAFQRASYQPFADEASAVAALKQREIDMILAEGGVSVEAAQQLGADDAVTLDSHPSHSMRFLVFNLADPLLADPHLRQAIACLLNGDALASPFLSPHGGPAAAFVADEYWRAVGLPRPCGGVNLPTRLLAAVEILKSAGYTWRTEPTPQASGHGLHLPGGEVFPTVTLLAPVSDPVRSELAAKIEQALVPAGIPVAVLLVDADDINYAVFSSHVFDLALVGWRLASYPGYLCDWFGSQGSFNFGNASLDDECDALQRVSELEQARRRLSAIQLILADELPFIPVYAETVQDAYRGTAYPFAHVIDGLSGLYGAPALALPAPNP